MTSKRRIKANKRNAKNSTGPKNTKKTRFNSIKHGIRAEKCFLPEDKKWIDKVQNDLEKEFNPKNIVEMFLIRRMVISMWKMNKVNEDTQCMHRVRDSKESFSLSDMREVLKSIKASCEEDKEVEEEEEESIPDYMSLKIDDELYQRYETAAENQFYKALDKLSELKKIR